MEDQIQNLTQEIQKLNNENSTLKDKVVSLEKLLPVPKSKEGEAPGAE